MRAAKITDLVAKSVIFILLFTTQPRPGLFPEMISGVALIDGANPPMIYAAMRNKMGLSYTSSPLAGVSLGNAIANDLCTTPSSVRLFSPLASRHDHALAAMQEVR